MGAIHPSSNPGNIRRSYEKHIVDNVLGTSGFPLDFLAANVWWPGRKIETGGLDYFLRVAFNELARAYHKAAIPDGSGGMHPGYLVTEEVSFEVWLKRRVYDSTPHALEASLSPLRAAFVRGQAIPMKNYQTGDGSTVLTYAVVETMNPVRTPDDKVWRTAGIAFVVHRHERDTAT